MTSPLSTLFLGTGDIGLPSLQWLIDSPACDLLAVYCQPDRPFGRKMTLHPPETKVLAQEHGVPVHQPESLRNAEDRDHLLSFEPDLIVVMAYGQILRRAIIDLPAYGCINLHASLLPRHRGASPIQSAILSGDEETGVTVMFIDEGLDSGDILLEERFPLPPDITGGILHDNLGHTAQTALARAFPLIQSGQPPRAPQDHHRATHLGKLSRDDGLLDWSKSAQELERLIRAFDPWPGTYTKLAGKKLKVFPPASFRDANLESPPGSILQMADGGLEIACGSGALTLRSVQQEGKKRQSIEEFARGNGEKLAPGISLG
ncbi:MAG: methionyl-tRNA formyltransferase [Verrucomicrobiota bacterium]